MLHRRDLDRNSKLLTSVYAQIFLSINKKELVDHAKLKEKFGLNLNKSTWSEKLAFLRNNKLIEETIHSRNPNRQEYATCYDGCLEFYFDKVFQAPDWRSPYINLKNQLFKYNFSKYLKNYAGQQSLYDIFTGFSNELGAAYKSELPVQLWRTRRVLPGIKKEMLKLFKQHDFSEVKTKQDIIDKFTGLGNDKNFIQETANIWDKPSVRAILAEESPRAMKASTYDRTTWTIFMWLCHIHYTQKTEIA